MRKLLSCILVVSFLFTGIFPVSAITISSGLSRSQLNTQNTKTLNYPSGTDFSTLKSLIETTFSPKQGYQYNCIADNTLCPNYKYTSIVEKAIKLIVLKTYEGNEEFYHTLLPVTPSYYSDDSDELVGSSYPAIQTVLARIPSGTKISDWKTFGFDRSIGSQLLDASFGVDFSENSNSYGMLGAIDQKINELKTRKCQQSGGMNCYGVNISNRFLPSIEELDNEMIYLNGNSVQIGSLKDEFEYLIDGSIQVRDIQDSRVQEDAEKKKAQEELARIFSEAVRQAKDSENNGRDFENFQSGEIQSIDPILIEESFRKMKDAFDNRVYDLRYKKEFYTLKEVRGLIENITPNNIILSSTGGSIHLPCLMSLDSQSRKECSDAMEVLINIQTTLGIYYSDRGIYPKTLDEPNMLYYLEQDVLTKFQENFSYKNTSFSEGDNPSFEIKYIGHIGENTSSTGTTMKRDYVALLSGATIPEIPSLFAHVPSESMVLYVRNPANLLDILNQKSNTSTRLSGVDVSESIRKFMMTFFELENFDQIQSHLKNEMAIVVNNLDATAPDIVVILSEADRDALSPTAKARVVESKDGFIFIASSKESLEQLTNLTAEKSLSSAPDFRYVWMKKSQKIQDAFMFVGDEFFEKMLTFETYLSHYRKYRDYARLWALQEMVWAYSDAFGQLPTSLNSLSQLGISSLTGATLAEYSIQDGIVVHKNIGSLKSLKTLPEAHYDFSRITRSEIEDYKTNVLKYREIWRSSLDPMGIVLNRYGDGMEIDFFMTPIPAFEDRDIQEMQKFFGNIAKDSLSFVTNPRIRSGIVSFVFGFDVQKLQQSIQSEKSLQSGFDEFSQEVLDGKNIFDYIGGEFAFSLGGLDPDILDGWNVEKVDVYGSVQVTNEEKGKELIDMLRKKILAEFDRSSSSEAELIKGFLAKPLIEDYNTRKIYYVEGLPIPFVGKIGFAYTFIDNFFIIGLNRSTIRKVIDIANSSDTRKKELIDAGSFSTGTVFATIFDGVGSSAQLRALYEKNKTSIPRYMKYLKMNNLSNDSGFRTLLSSYYATQDRNHRLAVPVKQFSYTLGALSLGGDTENIIVRLDEQKLATLTGTTLQTWENLRSESDFPKEILAESGMTLTDVLAYKSIEDLVSLAIISHLNTVFDDSESLFRNTIFGLNIGDDEIGFSLRMFRHKGTTTSNPSPISQEVLVISLFIFIILLCGGFLTFLVLRKRKFLQSNIPPVTSLNSISSDEKKTSTVSNISTSVRLDATSIASLETDEIASNEVVSSNMSSVISGEVLDIADNSPHISKSEIS